MTSIPKLAGGHTHISSLVDEPLEDGPGLKPCLSVETQDNRGRRGKWRRAVTFAERSEMCIYSLDLVYARIKSYKKRDYGLHGTRMLSEALNINRMAYDTGLPFKESLKYLLKNGIVSWEEIVGIEHFMGQDPTNVRQARRDHTRAVLAEQERQRTRGEVGDRASEALGRFSDSRTAESAKLAGIRAAMARKPPGATAETAGKLPASGPIKLAKRAKKSKIRAAMAA